MVIWEYTEDGGGRIPFANVINVYVAISIQSHGIYLDIDLSRGEGIFFTGGKVVAIKWYKEEWYDCFHFTLEEGTPLEFSKGKTFICVNQFGNNNYQGTCMYE